MSEPTDPSLAPDAPLKYLLSLKHNKRVADMTLDQLKSLVQTCRSMVASAPTLSAKLQTDSIQLSPRKKRKAGGVNADTQKILDSL